MFELLPRDVFYQIIFDFGARELHKLLRVNRYINKMINCDQFWEKKITLLANGFRIRYPDINYRNALLVAAASYGLTQYVIKYVRRGANINVKLYHCSRKTAYIYPIHYAAHCGNPSTVKELIRHHALFKAPKKVEVFTSPLHFAIAQGNIECAEVLLMKGVNVNQEADGQYDFRIYTPLQISVLTNQVPCYQLLRSFGADVNFRLSRESDAAVHTAIQHGSLAVLKLLLLDGADPNAYTEEDPVSPLALACDAGNPEVLLELLRHGADPRAYMTLFMDQPALHYALCRKKFALAKLLLEFDSSLVDYCHYYPNADNRYKWDKSALHCVARLGCIESIRLLIQYQADPHLLYDGRTAYDIAIEEGHMECAELLAEYSNEYDYNKICCLI